MLFDSKETDVKINGAHKGQSLKVSRDEEKNTIWSIVRENKNNKGFEDYDVVHLINLLNNDTNWRNAAAKPNKYEGLTITYPIGKTEKDLPKLKVYTASPDHDMGQMKEIPYKWDNTNLIITLPSLEYWEMIVINHDGLQKEKQEQIFNNSGDKSKGNAKEKKMKVRIMTASKI
nr:glycoside hydrolase family 66 protein [Bacillus taeanensis]